jgi:tetratricopeptide (TPR) repeat protein
MRQGMTDWRATAGGMGRPGFLAYVAEACGPVGRREEGLAAVAEALDLVRKTGEGLYEIELYRVKGDLLLAEERSTPRAGASRGNIEQAEECFLQAIAIAQNQGAKSLELRAVMGLAPLWRKRGKRKEARQMLSEIYGWFTEGFDTRDLREAKALLGELTAATR